MISLRVINKFGMILYELLTNLENDNIYVYILNINQIVFSHLYIDNLNF